MDGWMNYGTAEIRGGILGMGSGNGSVSEGMVWCGVGD